MSIVKRFKPFSTTSIKFNFIDSTELGMLNLCRWEKEINLIDKLDHVVVDSNHIRIYIPIFDNYFVKYYDNIGNNHDSGFTLKKLLNCIIDASLEAGKYDVTNFPEHYLNATDARDFINEFAITCNDIKRNNNDIFVNFQH